MEEKDRYKHLNKYLLALIGMGQRELEVAYFAVKKALVSTYILAIIFPNKYEIILIVTKHKEQINL